MKGRTPRRFFDVKVGISGYEFFFNDLTLVKKKEGDGLFIRFPSRPGKKEGDYFHFCNANKKAKEEIEKVAMAEYQKESQENQLRQGNSQNRF